MNCIPFSKKKSMMEDYSPLFYLRDSGAVFPKMWFSNDVRPDTHGWAYWGALHYVALPCVFTGQSLTPQSPLLKCITPTHLSKCSLIDCLAYVKVHQVLMKDSGRHFFTMVEFNLHLFSFQIPFCQTVAHLLNTQSNKINKYVNK